MALAFKMRKESRVAVAFMGDGATNEGAFHEAVNMGAIWELPVLYVIENNLYSASTPIAQTTHVAHLADRASAYGIPGVTIDGNDVLAVYAAAQQAVARARAGEGPTLIEAITYRITGHSRRDPCLYQPEAERKAALEHEPIRRFAGYLLEEGIASAGHAGSPARRSGSGDRTSGNLRHGRAGSSAGRRAGRRICVEIRMQDRAVFFRRTGQTSRTSQTSRISRISRRVGHRTSLLKLNP